MNTDNEKMMTLVHQVTNTFSFFYTADNIARGCGGSGDVVGAVVWGELVVGGGGNWGKEFM